MFKKKILALITFLIMIGTLLTGSLAAHAAPTIPALKQSAVFTIGSQTVTVDGTPYQMDVAPYIDSNGRTVIPVRYLAEVLGAYAVTWDPSNQTVDLGFDNPGHVDLTIGKSEIGYSGTEHPMDTAPVIVPPGRTMLPARFVAQAVGDAVSWDAANRTVTVTAPVQGTSQPQYDGGGPGGSMINDGGGNSTPGPGSGTTQL
ncbi:MAG: copper amine oxidase N-terminal domain-containing protein [Peptococcaceae bacterium]|nr:copper amine oxidase N-terminal domain-containing protein [Peptococcaceae bacterium]